MTKVSAGIIRDREGKILACRRGEGRSHAHLWEFPGGKREPGEDAAACLARELREELSLPVEEIRPVRSAECEGIRFTFLEARTGSRPVLSEHEEARFVRPRELLRLRFCPADAPVARDLALAAVRCFLWDFDGTLADTYPGLSASFHEACAQLNVILRPGEALSLLKQSLQQAADTVAETCGLSADALLERFHRIDSQHSLSAQPPMPFARETLEALRRRGARHILVTHRGSDALDWLDAHGLSPLFDGHVTREDRLPRKPAPDMALRAASLAACPPEDCMMVGDRPLDAGAALAAGALACLLDDEERFPDTPCDLRIRSLAELLPA